MQAVNSTQRSLLENLSSRLQVKIRTYLEEKIYIVDRFPSVQINSFLREGKK